MVVVYFTGLYAVTLLAVPKEHRTARFVQVKDGNVMCPCSLNWSHGRHCWHVYCVAWYMARVRLASLEVAAPVGCSATLNNGHTTGVSRDQVRQTRDKLVTIIEWILTHVWTIRSDFKYRLHNISPRDQDVDVRDGRDRFPLGFCADVTADYLKPRPCDPKVTAERPSLSELSKFKATMEQLAGHFSDSSPQVVDVKYTGTGAAASFERLSYDVSNPKHFDCLVEVMPGCHKATMIRKLCKQQFITLWRCLAAWAC
jgi:hypothetical protein